MVIRGRKPYDLWFSFCSNNCPLMPYIETERSMLSWHSAVIRLDLGQASA